MNGGKGSQSGFTLLEVMIAVTIMGFVLVSLLGLKNRSMQDVLFAQHITTATTLAKTMMADMITTRSHSIMEAEGPFPEDAYRDYTWKKSVATTPFIGIMEVRIAVLWTEGSRQESVELVGYE